MRFSLSAVDPLDGQAVLSVAVAKAWVRVLHDLEDDLIGSLRDAALDLVEQHTGKSLLLRSFEWRGRFGAIMPMGIDPVASITSVSYLDAEGVSQTLVAADYLKIGLYGQLEAKSRSTVFPETLDGDAPVTIQFEAGYAADECPQSLLQAALMMVAHYYTNREAVTVGVEAAELPLGFCQLCRPFRSVRV